MFLLDSKTVLLQGKARYNEELSQCHKLNPLENLEVDSIKGISK
jgi:hypothetical protein